MTPTEALFALKASTEDVRRQLDRVPFASVREAFHAWESAWIAWAEAVTQESEKRNRSSAAFQEWCDYVSGHVQRMEESHAT